MCIRHGGGNRCQAFDDDLGTVCGASAKHSTNGTGNSDMCIRHGGGNRCQVCCTDIAVHIHPITSQSICTPAARFLVTEALRNGDSEVAERLKNHFGFKTELLLRAEHVIHHYMRRRIPELKHMACAIDEDAVARFCAKTKTLQALRADAMYLEHRTRVGFHLEVDETPDHEDDDERLRAIHMSLDMLGRVYVVRIHAHLYDHLKMCDRKTKRNGTAFYVMNDRGRKIIDEEVEPLIRKILVFMEKGEIPNENRPWKAVVANKVAE